MLGVLVVASVVVFSCRNGSNRSNCSDHCSHSHSGRGSCNYWTIRYSSSCGNNDCGIAVDYCKGGDGDDDCYLSTLVWFLISL